MVTIHSGLRGTNGQPSAPPYNNGPYTWDENLTLSGTNTQSGAFTQSGAGTITGNMTFTGTNTFNSSTTFSDQVMRCVVASTASTEWLGGNIIGTYPLAASLTAKSIVFPLQGLKTGDVINGYRVIGQIESGGNVAGFNSYLRSITAGTADPTEVFVATADGINATADRRLFNGTASLTSTVASGESWIVVCSATTGASTDIHIIGVEVDVDRK